LACSVWQVLVHGRPAPATPRLSCAGVPDGRRGLLGLPGG